ncbi:MAG: hypothetical protein AAFV77_13200 [Planctomycetota bacterium]
MAFRDEARHGATLTQACVGIAMVVVLAVVAVPMLGASRLDSGSRTALDHARDIARGIELAATDTGLYAPAYRRNEEGGFTHHSAALMAGGYVADERTFTSPLVPDGGAPSAGDHVTQAEHVAFTVNGAIMPPEPLAYSGTDRHYQQVMHAAATPQSGARWTRQAEPIAPASTMLVTEWYAGQNWGALMQGQMVMSHRPIVPFVGGTSGRSPEREAVAGASVTPFEYPGEGEIFGDGADFREVLTSRGSTEVNATGRTHRTNNGQGAAWIVMLDGSARLATPWQTVEQRLWGRAFHSITGGQGVR